MELKSWLKGAPTAVKVLIGFISFLAPAIILESFGFKMPNSLGWGILVGWIIFFISLVSVAITSWFLES